MNILYFSPIMWNDLKQRPQHIAEELSVNHNVYFIEPSLSVLTNTTNYKTSIKIINNITIIRPNGFRLPLIIDNFDILKIGDRLLFRQIKKYFNICDVIWFGSPIYYRNILCTGKFVVYDKMDDYSSLVKNSKFKKYIRKNEDRLIERADKIFTTSSELQNKLGKESSLIPNGIEKNFVVSNVNLNKKNSEIIFGYIGTVDHWFDMEAIKTIINASNNNKIIIVGNNNIPQFMHPRVTYISKVDKSTVYGYIQKFDYCLYPFLKNSLLNTINPVKIYEYLAFNKIVIAVGCDETRKFENYINLYENYEELNYLLKKISTLKSPFNDKQKHQFIEQNSWENRCKKIIEVIKYGY